MLTKSWHYIHRGVAVRVLFSNTSSTREVVVTQNGEFKIFVYNPSGKLFFKFYFIKLRAIIFL